jgi:hypothetical protein
MSKSFLVLFFKKGTASLLPDHRQSMHGQGSAAGQKRQQPTQENLIFIAGTLLRRAVASHLKAESIAVHHG